MTTRSGRDGHADGHLAAIGSARTAGAAPARDRAPPAAGRPGTIIFIPNGPGSYPSACATAHPARCTPGIIRAPES